MHGLEIIRGQAGLIVLGRYAFHCVALRLPTDYVLYIAKGCSRYQRFMRQPCLALLKFDSCVITR